MAGYQRAAASAKRQIDAKGRDVTLIRLDGSTPDPAKPWRGASDPRNTPEVSATYRAAFIPLSGESKLGLSKTTQDLIKKADKTCLIGTQDDLSQFNEMLDSDGSGRFKITAAEVLAPGDTIVLWYLVLNQ